MHRPNTDEELRGMLGGSIADAYRTVQHDAFDEDGLVSLGRTHIGHETVVNRVYMETAVSILSVVPSSLTSSLTSAAAPRRSILE